MCSANCEICNKSISFGCFITKETEDDLISMLVCAECKEEYKKSKEEK